jgi:hypothetical protein
MTVHSLTLSSQNQSQSYFVTGGLPPIISSWRQAPWDSRPAFFFLLNACGHSPYVTSSLTRGWVCRLQLLLVLASAVILVSEFRGAHDGTLLSQIRDPSTWRAKSPYLCPPGIRWPRYIHRHWVPYQPQWARHCYMFTQPLQRNYICSKEIQHNLELQNTIY